MGLYEGIKDVAQVVQKADNIDLYRQLLDLSAQALDMQAEIARLKEENTELKKAKDLSDNIIRHNQPYITLRNDSQSIKYCAVCWGNSHKLIQMYSYRSSYNKDCLLCRICSNSCENKD